MANYSVTVPPGKLPAHESGHDLANRIASYLKSKDIYVSTVVVKTGRLITGADESIPVSGFYVEVDCNQSPLAAMADFPWDPSTQDDDDVLREFVNGNGSGDQYYVLKILAKRAIGLA